MIKFLDEYKGGILLLLTIVVMFNIYMNSLNNYNDSYSQQTVVSYEK